MTATTTSIEEELEQELRGASARVVVWLAVAAGIAMAVLQAVRMLQRRREGRGD